MPYVKQNFQDGQVLYAAQMNHIEDGIGSITVLDGNGAGFHNSVFRGKNLGTAFTAEQQAAIANGQFDDMFIGDYWVIGGVKYMIADFDYYLNTGDTAFTAHHVIVVPMDDTYTYNANDGLDITKGYYGNAVHSTGMEQWRTKFKTAFGDAHMASHRLYFVTDIDASMRFTMEWKDSDGCELMCERNVFGETLSNVVSTPQFVDKQKYHLFSDDNTAVNIGVSYWLQDVYNRDGFSFVDKDGLVQHDTEPTDVRIRPRFVLK